MSGLLLWMWCMLTWVSVAGQLSTSRAVIQEAIYAVAATARDRMIRLDQQELAAFNAGTGHALCIVFKSINVYHTGRKRLAHESNVLTARTQHPKMAGSHCPRRAVCALCNRRGNHLEHAQKQRRGMAFALSSAMFRRCRVF